MAKNFEENTLKPCDNTTCMNYQDYNINIIYNFTHNKVGISWTRDFNYMVCLWCSERKAVNLFKENPYHYFGKSDG